MSINKTIISGNVTADPELRATANGTQVLSFKLANNSRRFNKTTGQWEDGNTCFIGVVLYGNRAAALAKRISKGTGLVVEGRLHYGEWADAEGRKHSKHEIIADDILFTAAKAKAQDPADDVYGEDIPF